jgi:hypothetical protein
VKISTPRGTDIFRGFSENVDTNDESCLGAARTKEPDDVHFDRKGMLNREKEGTSTLTHPAHGLLDVRVNIAYKIGKWSLNISGY